MQFPRGDSYQQGFILKRNGAAVTDPFDEIYFTVKKYATDKDYIFQKRLTTGGIVSDGNGHYTLSIEPEDTNGLQFAEYACDVEIKAGDYKRTFCGKLMLTPEVTHLQNE